MAIAFCSASLFRMSSGMACPTIRRGRDAAEDGRDDIDRVDDVDAAGAAVGLIARERSGEAVAQGHDGALTGVALGGRSSAWATLPGSQAPAGLPGPLQHVCCG